MLSFKCVAVFALLAVAVAQQYDYEDAPRPAPTRVKTGYSGPAAPRPTPVAILKQINRHNEDGSYTYGYESGDGSFKIETKLPTGEVNGKYGYVDDTGKVRVVEYGATKHGFQPSGEGITVAPPTLVDETTNRDGTFNPEYSGAYYDDNQQQEIPLRAAPAPRPRPIESAFESYSAPQQFAPSRSSAPVPPRAVIPGAAPLSTTHNFEFGTEISSPSARNFAPARSFAPAPRPSYARPAPIEEDFGEPEQSPIRSSPRITYAQPAPIPRPQPQQQFAPNPAPQYAPRPAAPQYAPRPAAPQYSPRPAAAPGGRSSGGILDQLSKDYALPQGGAAPLHDISFGYY